VTKIILVFFSALTLISCTTISPVAPDDAPVRSWQQRQQDLANITSWEINGRIFLRTKKEGQQLNLRWVRRGDHHQIDLSGPLSIGHVRLTRDLDSVKLVADDKTYQAQDAEQLLADVIGARLPVNGLDYWIRGLPAPDAPSEQTLDFRNRLQQLRQSEWEILYQSYTRVGEQELPRVIFIKRIASFMNTAAEDIELRLAISSWTQPKKDSQPD